MPLFTHHAQATTCESNARRLASTLAGRQGHGVTGGMGAQEKEPRLPGLLKMLVWAQDHLDEKLLYPVRNTHPPNTCGRHAHLQ